MMMITTRIKMRRGRSRMVMMTRRRKRKRRGGRRMMTMMRKRRMMMTTTKRSWKRRKNKCGMGVSILLGGRTHVFMGQTNRSAPE